MCVLCLTSFDSKAQKKPVLILIKKKVKDLSEQEWNYTMITHLRWVIRCNQTIILREKLCRFVQTPPLNLPARWHRRWHSCWSWRLWSLLEQHLTDMRPVIASSNTCNYGYRWKAQHRRTHKRGRTFPTTLTNANCFPHLLWKTGCQSVSDSDIMRTPGALSNSSLPPLTCPLEVCDFVCVCMCVNWRRRGNLFPEQW